MTHNVDELDALLRTTPLFRQLSTDDRRTVAGAPRIGRYEKGQLIFEQGHTLVEACRERHVNGREMLAAVTETCNSDATGIPRFSEWDSDTLIAYIVGNHHQYVRRVLPVIRGHLQKLASHSTRHPALIEIARIFDGVSAEMLSHMAREEAILFPFILAVEQAARSREAAPPAPFGSIDNPLRVMEREHESTGVAMARIRELSGGYLPPDDACITFQVCLRELEAFEQDLHTHVHLENNLLFPRARALAAHVEL
jgi:regulator of cell morphogenesis and NO signaling